jgi:hypothetical protein
VRTLSAPDEERENGLLPQHDGGGYSASRRGDAVPPPAPEMIRNEDAGAETSKAGYEKQKQDCERKAAARLLEKHGTYYKTLRATVPGDDLYADHAACKAVPGQGLGFIFTCKDESHPRIAEQAGRCIMETPGTAFRAGRDHLEYRYNWTNGLENRADGENLTVNYLYFEIYNREKGKITYRNSWITDKTITKENVALLAECGRARWKIENENNNVLKNRGYRIEHNFSPREKPRRRGLLRVEPAGVSSSRPDDTVR